jgi:MerR family transcriptional regulator, light-induced transcriptional regulator
MKRDDSDSRSSSEALQEQADLIARRLTDAHYERHPGIAERYGPSGREKCLEDAHYHLRYLIQALAAGEPELFADYVRWARTMLETRGIPASDLRDNILLLETIVEEVLSSTDAAECFSQAKTALDQSGSIESCIQPSNPHGELARRYLELLLAGARADATRLILDAADSGVSLRDLYLDVFCVAQYELGRLWQTNEISVAEEHYSTAATQLIMSQLYPRIFNRPSNGLRLISATIGGELHEIGARMLSDLFELDGWDTFYLGANVPVRDLVREIQSRSADLVALSVTMSYHLGEASKAIRTIRENDGSSRVKIIVGGYPFRLAPDLWKEIGADGSAMAADEAVRLAKELVTP